MGLCMFMVKTLRTPPRGYSLEFHESAIHSEKCTMSHDEFENGFNMFKKKSHKEVYEETVKRDEEIANNKNQIIEHFVCWESEWRMLKKTDSKVKKFCRERKRFGPRKGVSQKD